MKNGYDVRAIANLVLEEGEILGRRITNLHLNKILYFMHVDFLREFGEPLISAKIEAWEHGPVFREVYNQFKQNGRAIIAGRAMKVDFDSGEKVVATCKLDDNENLYIKGLIDFYSGIPAGILVDMSHDKGGAWDAVWNHKGEFNVGMEISETLIRKFELNQPRKVTIVQ